MSRVRRAIAFAEGEMGLDRLLLRDGLWTSGQSLFLDHLDHLVDLTKSGQMALTAILASYLKRVERGGDGLPVRLFPLREGWSDDRKPVVIDPARSFGRPTLANSGVSTQAVVRRIDAGEPPAAVAEDYGIGSAEIEYAMMYERAA